MTTKLIETDLAIPAGEYLRKELEAREMSQRELAERMERPVQAVNEIVNGNKKITEDTALALERVLGVAAPFWLTVDTIAQLAHARASERKSLQDQVGWLARFPVSTMIRRGWIEAAESPADQVKAVLQFFGVASFTALAGRQEALGLRISKHAPIDEFALLCWVRKGELDGRAIETAEYDEAVFATVIQEARPLTRLSLTDALPILRARCAQAGVALVWTPEFPKIGANGVARWLTKTKALIQLNLRYRYADVFWFSFFHECGHIMSHRQRRVFVDMAGDHRSDVEETEADVFAEQTLIPTEAWMNLISADYHDSQVIERFAEVIGVDAGIVVGRLQKERLLPWNAMAGLKSRFTWREED